ncbi:MAG: ABC transporter ATP-binding protein [Clostridia bacterium]|nr:ABC transporter ATP-binding protein [Clostridia bacterium]
MIGEVLIDLFQPKLMSKIVDEGILGDGGLPLVIKTGVLMLGLVIIGGLCGTLCTYTSAIASQGFGDDLRCVAFRRVMSLSIEQTDKFTTGSLVTRMTNDISMLQDMVQMFLRMFVRAPMFLVIGAVFMITLAPSFGVVVLCSLPILILALLLILSKATPLYSKVQTKLDKVNSVVQENVSGARMVKAYVREGYENTRFSNANNDLRTVNYKALRLMAFLSPVLNIVMNLSVVAVIYIGGWQAEAGNMAMKPGNIMAAITYVTQILMSIMMVNMIFQSITRAAASAKRVNEVLDTDPTIVSGDQQGKANNVHVSFENVSFRYPGTKGAPVLHNINLEIRRGETFAIIGATGCGKSSLVNLIPRFYDATEGNVAVDGVNVKEMDLKILRQKIGFVMQKSELFSDTVANNIRWGNPDATDEEVRAAALVAQADEYISGFSEGYETFIAEKGASLSGGQKQRLSIARAVAKNPEILILDDSTSALDLATEAKLRRSLREKMSGATVIMIAQRIASVMEADRIAVIENGTVCDCGSHAYLMENSATYRDIYESQSKNGGVVRE